MSHPDIMDGLEMIGMVERRTFCNKGHCVDYGQNLTPDEMKRLGDGEIFTLVIAFNAVAYLTMDIFGAIRWQKLPFPKEGVFEKIII